MKSSCDGPRDYGTLTALGPTRRHAAGRNQSHRERGYSVAASAASASASASASSASSRWSAPHPPNQASERRGVSLEDAAAALAAPANAVDERPLCRYHFLDESCAYGDSCRFSHSFPPGVDTIEEARKCIPCHYYQRGNCKYGEACLFGHDSIAVPAAPPLAVSPSFLGAETKVGRGDEKQKWRNRDDVSGGGHSPAYARVKSGDRVEDRRVGGDNEEDCTCGICLEDVRSTELGKFGLLSCCDHRFCLSCLRRWRQTKATSQKGVRSCPTCRERSDYVIPSDRFVTGAEKERVVAEYRSRLAVKRCFRFDGSFGSCPFGRECFYAHFVDGKDVKERDRDPAEMAKERSGRRNTRRDRMLHQMIPPWILDDYAGSVGADDIEAIASFLALLSFYGYGFADDSDDDSDWDELD